ncbi:MAG TPA: cytochrome P460 family protein, partial [Candidatus Eisenbacteria bacterium]|nr:cytochrome P460 family protein [Candidatus Eisenbacteria bacterium]
ILPSDYLSTYVEVRDCRFSLEHGGVYIRVLTNPEAAQLYRDDAEQLPVGTVVVKEEFSDGHCEQNEIVRYRAMRKEAPGFDPEDGDWHWQFLTPRMEVAEDTKASCISCHRQPDCVRRDFMCTLPGSSAGLRPILDSLPAALLSVSGATPDDHGHAHGGSISFEVFAVGADPRDGRGPLVVHYDHEDAKWSRLSTGARGDLWWITDREVDGAFYMCGEDGLILEYSTEARTFRRMTTPGGKLLYGIWGVEEQSLYAVGGDPADEDAGGAVWRYNVVQEEWVVDQRALDARPGGLPTLYKIWGTSPSDIWAVGRRGTILYYNGIRWVDMATGVIRPLFTVHGDAQRVMAVGGA